MTKPIDDDDTFPVLRLAWQPDLAPSGEPLTAIDCDVDDEGPYADGCAQPDDARTLCTWCDGTGGQLDPCHKCGGTGFKRYPKGYEA